MFEQAFKNIDDILWKEAGCTTELDYTEQTSWLLFLKYLDGLEQDLADEAALNGKTYTYILDTPYRWESWAAPRAVPLRPRRCGRTRPGEAHAVVAAEVSQFHRRRPIRPWPGGGDWAGLRRVPEVLVSATIGCMTRTATHAKRLHARTVQIGGPLVHELAPPRKQVRAGVGRFDLVPDHVRQGCLGDLRARTFQQPLDPLADRGIWCRSPAAVRGFRQVDETRRVGRAWGKLLLYYTLGSDPALWPAGESIFQSKNEPEEGGSDGRCCWGSPFSGG